MNPTRLTPKVRTVPANPAPDPVKDFGSAWSWAWQEIFGDLIAKVPWTQIRIQAPRHGRCSYSLWMPKSEVIKLVDSTLDAEQRVERASYFEQFPFRGRGITMGKGVNATANALWDVRGDTLKEGLVLAHGLTNQLAKAARYNKALYILSDLEIPDLYQIGVQEPWHSASNEMFPSGIAHAYGEILHGVQPPNERRHPRWSIDLCRIVAAEFALCTIGHELVHIDVLWGERSEEFNPIYEHATQYGDP